MVQCRSGLGRGSRLATDNFHRAAFGTRYSAVNIGDLNQFEDGARVDETALRSVGLANGPFHGVKILGSGDLTKKLTLVVSAISASAKTKVEAKGGSVEIIVSKAAKSTADNAAKKTASLAAKKAAPAKK